jgi:hypothetical protein
VGKPNERERDLLFSFRKVHISSKITFPAKENTSQHQICPTEICLIFRAKTVLLYGLLRTSFFMPTVNCTDCSVRPINNHKILKSTLKTMPKMPRFPCQIRMTVRLYGSVQYGLPQQKKYFSPKQENFFLGIRALLPWKTCPLCCSLFSLKHTQKFSLTQHFSFSMSSQHSTCLAHYPMHSFII